MERPKHAWMVPAGDDNELVEIVKPESIVAIGCKEMGTCGISIRARSSRSAIDRCSRSTHQDAYKLLKSSEVEKSSWCICESVPVKGE